MRAPFKWLGGKGNMAAKLMKLLPAHSTYVEPYFGAGSVFFAKAPAEIETINDLDSAVAGFFRVLRDQPEEFIRLANATEYGREVWKDCRATWREEPDPVRRAWKWWVVAAMSFSGKFGGIPDFDFVKGSSPSVDVVRHNVLLIPELPLSC